MKKRLLTAALAVILTLSLAACGKDSGAKLPSISNGDNSTLGTDFQKDMNQSSSKRINDICETEGGYYFEYNSLIYYLDKETGMSTALCGKPDCEHGYSENPADCNAYANTNFLTYYDGKLYYTNDDYVLENGTYINRGERLFSMELDGTKHTVVQELEFVPGGNTSSYVTDPIIHRGKVYFCYSGALYVVNLGSDIKEATLIYGEEQADNGSMIFNPNELYYELWADADNVYFMAKNVKQSDGTYKDTLFCYYSKTGDLEKLWQVPDKSEVGSWDTTGVSVSKWYISNGYLYFYLSGNDVWSTELSSGKTKKIVDIELTAGAASFSDEYIIVINKEAYGVDLINGGASLSAGDTLYIYDYNGKMVNQISLKQIYNDCDNVSDCSACWTDDGKIYIHVNATIVGTINGNINTPTTQTHYIYVADITSGTLEKADWSFSKSY